MRTLEIIAAVFIALLVFAVLKLLGFIIKFAAVAALLGFIAGLGLVRLFRRR